MFVKDIYSQIVTILLPESLSLSLSRLQKELSPPATLSAPWLNAVCAYDSLGKEMVKAIKYKRNKKAINICAELIYEQILGELGDRIDVSGKIIVVSIPMPFIRRLSRQYNPAEELAHQIQKISNGDLYVDNSLLKKRPGKSQRECRTRSERLKNIEGRFLCPHPGKVAGDDIILVDDVITTGATMNEARSVLLKAGARSVNCFAVAH